MQRKVILSYCELDRPYRRPPPLNSWLVSARRGWRREERRRAGEEVQVGAEAEVRRERKGAGWAEEGRRGVGGLVERGSGAVWRYAGCLCGLSRGLIISQI